MSVRVGKDECIELEGNSPLMRELMSWKIGEVGYAVAKLAGATDFDLDNQTVSDWIKSETTNVVNHANEMVGNDRNVGKDAMRAMALMGAVAVNLSMSIVASLKESAELHDLNEELNR